MNEWTYYPLNIPKVQAWLNSCAIYTHDLWGNLHSLALFAAGLQIPVVQTDLMALKTGCLQGYLVLCISKTTGPNKTQTSVYWPFCNLLK